MDPLSNIDKFQYLSLIIKKKLINAPFAMRRASW